MCWLLNDMVHVYIYFFIIGPMNYHILLLCQWIPVFELWTVETCIRSPNFASEGPPGNFSRTSFVRSRRVSCLQQKMPGITRGHGMMMGWSYDDHGIIMGCSTDHGMINKSWDDHGIVFLPKSCVVLQTILKPGSEFSTEAIRGSHGWFPGGWAMICQTHPC